VATLAGVDGGESGSPDGAGEETRDHTLVVTEAEGFLSFKYVSALVERLTVRSPSHM
jgi:hypothetical protein